MMTSNFSVRRWLQVLGTVAAVSLLQACGGGGAASVPNPEAPLTLNPPDPNLYADLPTTFTILGGTKPYKAFSGDAQILPVDRDVTGNTFVVVPKNTNKAEFVEIDVTVNDNAGSVAKVKTKVFGNSITSAVTLKFEPVGGNVACSTAALCSGADGEIVFAFVLNGSGVANKEFIFEAFQGDFLFYTGSTTLDRTARIRTDAGGNIFARMRANVNAPTQVALVKITDASNLNIYRYFSLRIVQATSGADIITVVPDKVEIKSFYKGECSKGVTTDFYIFGGTPPYRVRTTFPQGSLIAPDTVTRSGAPFSATTSGFCTDPERILVTDATGREVTVEVKNTPGTEERPAPYTPFTLTDPGLGTLECGQSTSVIALPGFKTFVAASSVPSAVSASISGNVITINRINGTVAQPSTSPPQVIVTVSDGVQLRSVSLTVATLCTTGSITFGLQVAPKTLIDLKRCPSNINGDNGATENILVSGGRGNYSFTVPAAYVSFVQVTPSPITSLPSQSFTVKRIKGGPIDGGVAGTAERAASFTVTDGVTQLQIPFVTSNNCL